MATISASMVKELREKTGAGMMDCKAALEANEGEIEASVDWLRKKGLSKAAKKSGRVAAEGLIGLELSATKGVLVEVNSETDFVARNEAFQELVRSIAKVSAQVGTNVESVLAAKHPTGVPVSEAAMITYGVSATPTFVVIDKKGIVRFYAPTRLTEQRLALEIDKVLR